MKYISLFYKIAFITFICFFGCDENPKLSLDGEMNFDLEKSLSCFKKEGKELLIYFTGFGCVNCRYLEERILSDQKIARIIKENYEFVVLYVDDRTKIENKKGLVDIHGKRIKRNGELNVNYQIRLTRTGTQPLFAVVDRNEFTERTIAFNRNKDDFEAFLKTNSNPVDAIRAE